jgi:hypothetical protein
MIRRRTASSIALLLTVLVAAACGDSGDGTASGASTTTVPTAAPTTPTTVPVPTWPLTGLPASDPALLTRPALVVKIDNAEPKTGIGGRPQTGLNQADVVYEEVVEGSVTRFAAVFHSTDSDPVGPVRSARTTDIAIFTPLHRPLFAWSGANADFLPLIRGAPIIDVGYDAASGAFHRTSDRHAPYNLYSSTPALFALAPADAVAPPPLFTYRAAGAPPVGGTPVSHVHIVYGDGPGSAPVDYVWDANVGGWARSQRGSPHVDSAGVQIAPPNVVIQFTPYAQVGCCVSGYPVLEAQLVGEGEAWVLTGGQLIQGRWSKPSADAVTSYVDGAGTPIGLTPGRTWVSLAPPGSATSE